MSSHENWCQTTPVPPKGDDDILGIPALCEMGWRPIMITGFLRDWMIRHFATPLTIETPDLRKYVWSNDERTGILIESVHRWKDDLIEKRPAILIKRNPYAGKRVAINDLSGGIGRTADKQYEQHTVLWVGSHTLFCIHGTGASTDILATEVQRELTEFSPKVREYLRMLKFAVTEVGPISEVEEATENYVVPVTVAWAYQETWRLRLEALPLRRIPLTTLLDCEDWDDRIPYYPLNTT